VDQPPRTTDELLSEIDHEWKALWDVVGRLTPEQVTSPLEGGWSPKDHLAHLMEWTRVLIEFRMDGKAPHEVMRLPPEMIDRWDFDEMNAALYERDRGLTIQAVSDELKGAYEEATNRLRSMPFDLLIQSGEPEGGGPRLLERVLGYTAEHFAEHRQTIQESL
jgi:hypothetical protein